ncbi:MAG: hypothetical protein Q4G46_15020 [Propionibacteriaceae bacterium]|nr:hypothetical protein [Propionibacteriaceae bacterium]
MASLIARELAWLEGDDLMVSPIVEVPVKALVREGVDVSLALTIGGEVGLSSFRALADGAGSLLISVVGPGVVDIKLQSEEMAATEVLVRVVSGLLATEDAAVTLGCAGTVLQIRHTDDRWEARTLQESPFEPIAAADVRDRITEMFGPLLEGRA